MTTTSKAVAGLLAAAAVLAIVLTGGGSDDTYTVKAIYADASGLTKDYDVKVGGVPAGSIKKVQLDSQDRAVLTLELDKGAAPIGVGAKALARPVNLLGEKYIDLEQGDRSRPLPSGSTIALANTGSPVELDDVLNTLDPGTRARLRILINEAGTALAGRGADFNQLLKVLPASIDQTRRVVAEAGQENARLERAIAAGDRIIASVSTKRGDLQRLVSSAGDALKTVAQRRQDLGATVASAPSALRQLTGTLTELKSASSDLIPAAHALRQATPPLAQVLAELPDFADQARVTLAEATDVAPQLASFGRRATPDVKRLNTTARKLGTFAHDLAPVAQGLDRGVLRDAISLMHGWSHVIARSDGLGHIFRVRVKADQELITSALTRYNGSLQPLLPKHKAKHGKPAAVKAPVAAAPAPAPAKTVKPLLHDVVPKVVTTVTDAVGKVLDPVTGPGGVLPKVTGGLTGATAKSSAPAKGAGMLRLFDYLFGN